MPGLQFIRLRHRRPPGDEDDEVLGLDKAVEGRHVSELGIRCLPERDIMPVRRAPLQGSDRQFESFTDRQPTRNSRALLRGSQVDTMMV